MRFITRHTAAIFSNKDLASGNRLNAPRCSKMRGWKEVTLALILFGASCFLLLVRTTLPAVSYPKALKFPERTSEPLGAAPESSSSSSSSVRKARATEEMGSLLSEFSYLFQSFTEGELRKMIASLVTRKQRSIRTEMGRRSKRARKGQKLCSLHEINLTVSQLRLGYDSEETVRFRYCSGKCMNERRNYDLVMDKLQLNNGSCEKPRPRREIRRRKDKPRYTPCCRPTKFEKKMSFFDNNNKFYTLQNVSAKACGCV
ncbi:hypothetical protein DNTS_032653 [Danionella cerebrum]|uniref:TGF-beta family profile domain-containing protein n=1 Tax=Danionella cerebrum TaxID=2873325 RepID=A0A553MPQ4_9TELE|nr:hypothetical protein DNTS_032653 [Danionella translucida]